MSSAVYDAAAKVSEPVLLGFSWAGFAITTLFVTFRLAVRLRTFKKLLLDDLFVILAWAMILTSAIIWQCVSWRLYEEYAVASGEIPFTPGFIEDYGPYIHKIAVFNILFYSALWCVKLSFLIFFKGLGSRQGKFTTWWWIVLVITILFWIPCVADINWPCAVTPVIEILEHCPGQAAIEWNNITFVANCVLDLVSDVLIISIPIIILWPVKLPWSKKLMLMGIFSATVLVMVISIVRVSVVHQWNENADMSWLYFWTNLEMAVAIIVACVASFRQLFVNVQNAKSPHGKAGTWNSWRRLLPTISISWRGGDSARESDSMGTAFKERSSSEHGSNSIDGVHLQSIHVKHDYSVDNQAILQPSHGQPFPQTLRNHSQEAQSVSHAY